MVALQAAIQAAIKGGGHKTVLDIGTGTGLLSMIAATAGANRVFAVEGSPVMARIAAETLRRNKMAGRVALLGAMSTSLRVPQDIPEPRPTLLVSEILDSGLLGERVLPSLRHAIKHLLAPGGCCIPAAATVIVQCIECPQLRRQHVLSGDHASDHAGFGLTQDVVRLWVDEPYTCEQLANFPHRVLTDSKPILHLRLDGKDGGTDLVPGKKGSATLRATTTGTSCSSHPRQCYVLTECSLGCLFCFGLCRNH